MADFGKCIDKVLVNEGGYVDDPSDNGGATKFGISQRSYPNVNIKKLTLDEAKKIYKKDYWDKIEGDKISSNEVAYEIFDTAVNMGVRTSSKLAQLVADCHPDGFIGNKTLSKLNHIESDIFISNYKLVKIARYVHICKTNPKNRKFFFGWINRVLGA